ncbi:hypothetical protein [Brevibacillus sp. SYP-B805]|nr:hypothetical protein [Brevibacillus sp. SYP-B805]
MNIRVSVKIAFADGKKSNRLEEEGSFSNTFMRNEISKRKEFVE